MWWYCVMKPCKLVIMAFTLKWLRYIYQHQRPSYLSLSTRCSSQWYSGLLSSSEGGYKLMVVDLYVLSRDVNQITYSTEASHNAQTWFFFLFLMMMMVCVFVTENFSPSVPSVKILKNPGSFYLPGSALKAHWFFIGPCTTPPLSFSKISSTDKQTNAALKM